MSATQVTAEVEIALTALSVATGATSPTEGAKRILQLLPDLIPVDQLKEFLLDRDRIFADLSVDVAEQIELDGSDKR